MTSKPGSIDEQPAGLFTYGTTLVKCRPGSKRLVEMGATHWFEFWYLLVVLYYCEPQSRVLKGKLDDPLR